MKRSDVPFQKRSLTILFFLITHNVYALSAVLEIDKQHRNISFNSTEKTAKELFDSIESGYTSELFIQTKIYKKRFHSFYMPFDDLISERTYISQGNFDRFTESYAIITDLSKLFIEAKDQFIRHFFTQIIPMDFNIRNSDNNSEYYVKIKTTLINRLFLHLLIFIILIIYGREKLRVGSEKISYG